MKKLFYILLIAFTICLSACSFETYATTQDDIHTEYVEDIVYSDIDMNIVIRYGRPYYYNGSILYYFYNNIYYYPYYYNNYWYMRAYRRPFPHINYYPYFRPHRYDYRFSPGYHRPHNWYRYTPTRPRYDSHRPNYRPDRNPNLGHPNGNNPPSINRPNTRPQTYPQRGESPTISRPNTNSRPIGGNRPSTFSGGRSTRGGRGGR